MRYLNLLKNIDNWQEYLLYKFRIRRSDPLIFYCKNGIVAEVPIRLLHTFKEIFLEECYTKYLPQRRLQNNLTVVDIGANAGYFSLFMLSRYPGSQIIAFEPIANNFELLKRNRNINSLHNFIIVNKAVYGKAERVTLRYKSTDSFTTTGSIFGNELGHAEIEVDAITLPQMFETYALESVDLLKLDCEGAEYHILYNCPARYFKSINCIVMECHRGERDDENKAALCEYLKALAYNLRADRGDMVWAWRGGIQRSQPAFLGRRVMAFCGEWMGRRG